MALPAIFLTLVSLIQAASTSAPQALALFKTIRDTVSALFTAKLITKEQQDELFARMDVIVLATIRGEVPPHWAVDPDPES